MIDTLLVVEDNPADRDTICYLLADHFNIITADTGAAGLLLAQRAQPTAILLDYVLPDMTGLEFLTAIDADMIANCPAVVILTGRADLPLAVACLQHGAHDFLTKDMLSQFNAVELRQIMNNSIQRVALKRQLHTAEYHWHYYQTVAENTDTLLFAVDTELRYTVVSAAYAALYNSTPVALRGQYAPAVIRPDISPELCAHLRAVRDDGYERQFLLECYAHDQRCWLETTLRPLPAPFGTANDELGAPARCGGVVGSLHDVTALYQVKRALESEHTQLEERVIARTAALQRSEQYLRLAVETTQLGVWDWETTTDQIVWLGQHEQLWGYAPGEFDGTFAAFARRIHPDDLPSVVAELSRCDADHVPYRQEFRVVWPDGSVRWVLSHGQFRRETATDGLGRHMSGIVLDITAAKEAEAARRLSELRLSMIATAAHDAIVMVDSTGNIEFWNDAAERMFGYSAAEIMGQNLHALLVPPAIRAFAQHQFHQFCDTGAGAFIDRTVEITAIHCDGHELVLEVSLSAVPLNGIWYAIGVMRDISERKAAELITRQFEAIVQSSLDPIISKTLAGIVTSWNPAAERVFGYSAAEMIGQSISVLFPPAYAHEESELLARLVAGEVIPYFESQRRTKDGTVRDVSISISPLRTADGHVIGAAQIARDITAQKQIIAQLEQLLADVHDLYHNAPTGYHSLDANGIIVTVNDTELKWLGYTREEMIGQHVTRFLTPESAVKFHIQYPLFIASGQARDVEFEFVRKDGSILYALISTTAIFDDHGHYLKSRTVVVDFTQIHHQQELLHTILSAAPMAVRITTLTDHRVLFMNNAFAYLLRRTPDTTLGMDVSGYYADAAAFAGIIARLQHGERVLNQLVELHFPAEPDAPHVWVIASYMTLDYEHEPAVLAWLFDVTALREAQSTAERATRAKSEFLAHMSHEIRTPMNGIIGLAELALQHTVAPTISDYLTKIHQSGINLLGIINDVLDDAKIEAGRLELDVAPFELHALLEQQRSVLAPIAHPKGVELVFIIPSELPPYLIGDALRLQQILSNLIGNALKFTEQGSVTVQLDCIAQTAAQVQLRWSVIDTGIGMGPNTLAQLFQPFNQGDASITRRFGGTGLGLAISRNLIELMGGRLEVASTPGVGSRFSFELTLPIADSTTLELEPVAVAVDVRGARLLVAEDQPINQRVIGDMLRLLGVDVTIVAHGQEALDCLARQSFDAVLMDVQMPVMDGLTATRRLRADPRWHQLPIIALTAGVTTAERQHIHASGMSDLLPKPVRLAALTRMLERWVPAGPRVGTTDAPVTDVPVTAATDATAGDTLTLPGFALEHLEMIMERAELIDLLQQFAASAGELPTVLAQAVAAEQVDEARAIVHRIRGTAANMGAVAVAAAAEQVEDALWADGHVAPALLVALQQTNHVALAAIATLSAPPLDAVATAAPVTDHLPLVLLVDDEPLNHTIMADTLRYECRVEGISHSRDALARLTTGTAPLPDLLLLDVTMPDMDGYELCRHLKNEPHTAAIPVIFVTARRSDTDQELGFGLGGVDYITKPFTPLAVRARIRTHLQLKRHTDHLEQLAHVDPLTGVANRRRLMTVLEQECHRAARHGQPLSVMILDIDHFKAYNDHYGHGAGDDCLRHVAAALAQVLKRSGDLLARYGGEEFVIVLPHADTTTANTIAGQLHTAVDALHLPHAYSQTAHEVSFSLGGISVVIERGSDVCQQLLAQADQLLYRAKAAGRNCSMLA